MKSYRTQEKLKSYKLLKSKIKIVEETLKETVTSQLYGDGTGNGGKDLTGLEAAIATTGVYGGINRTTYDWWRAKVVTNNGTTPGTATTLSLNNMMRLFLALSDGNDQPDVLLCGMATWHEYFKLVEAKIVLNTTVGKKLADYGFQTLSLWVSLSWLTLTVQRGLSTSSTVST